MTKNEIRTYEDLFIWQKAMTLVPEANKLSKSFPVEEQYSLTSQIRRCAVSIPSNIAKSFGRNLKQDFISFLGISMGSLFELQTQIRIALNLKYIIQEVYNVSLNLTKELERMLSSFIHSIQK